MAKPTIPGYLTEIELCARLGIHRRTLKRWQASGDGPPRTVLPGRGGSLFNEQRLAEWLASREQAA